MTRFIVAVILVAVCGVAHADDGVVDKDAQTAVALSAVPTLTGAGSLAIGISLHDNTLIVAGGIQLALGPALGKAYAENGLGTVGGIGLRTVALLGAGVGGFTARDGGGGIDLVYVGLATVALSAAYDLVTVSGDARRFNKRHQIMVAPIPQGVAIGGRF